MNPVFFTDRDLGKRFPAILRDAGLTVERHADHFAHDCPDETRPAFLTPVVDDGEGICVDDEQRSHRRKDRASAAKRKDASDSLRRKPKRAEPARRKSWHRREPPARIPPPGSRQVHAIGESCVTVDSTR